MLENLKIMSQTLETSKFILIGSNLSLDFVNTKIVADDKPKDLFENFADLVAWLVAVNLLEQKQAENLLADWADKGQQILREAINFRTILHELFTEIMAGKAVRKSAVKVVNEMLQNQNGYAELRQTSNGFEKYFRTDYQAPRQLFAPIAASATDLLCYGNLNLLKKCESENCVLYFYDTTKNHSRRWCAMAHCGNRAKANAFYKRKKAQIKAQL